MEKEKSRVPKRRPAPTGNVDKDVVFATGMIMTHKKYNYDCVISGWDQKCQAERVRGGGDGIVFFFGLVQSGPLRRPGSTTWAWTASA